MPKDKIRVVGPWIAWDDHVRRGHMVRPDGEEVPVLLRGLPQASNASQLRKDGRLLSVVDHPQVLRLLHITKAAGRPLWIYQGFEAASLSRVLQMLNTQGEYLPIRTCLEMVQAVAEGLSAGLSVTLAQGDGAQSPPEVFHPGVAPSEILLDGAGDIKVAGFRVRRQDGEVDPGPAGFCDPANGTPAQSAAYAVGALLVQLLSGEAPAAGSPDPERHRSIVRRALIRVLSRPGEAVADPVIDLIRSSMGAVPDERPSLDALAEQFSKLARDTGDAALSAWAPIKVAPILQQQETGFPSEEETRKRRYVDSTSLHSDEPSHETPPIRRPPREVPTVLAKPGEGLSLAVGRAAREAASMQTGETEPARVARDLVASVDHSISLPMPESMVDGIPAVGIDQGQEALAGSVPMEIQSNDWSPLDSPTEGKRTGGWIMVAGVLAGMVVAGLVAWVAMDRFLGTGTTVVDAAEQAEQVEAMQADEAADAMAGAANSSAEVPPAPPEQTEPEPPETPESPETPEVEAAPEPPAPPQTPDAPPPQVSPPPPPVEKKPAKPKAEAPPKASPGERFPVTFRNADPSVTLLEVRCHIGRGSGAKTVRIQNAGPGPCRVIGHRAGQGKLIVSAVLTRGQSFTCFANGKRSCE